MFLTSLSVAALLSLDPGVVDQARQAWVTGHGNPVPRVYLAAQDNIPQSMYRDGGPAVLSPPKEEETIDTSAVERKFKSLYAKQGAPRMAFYWNRELSDRLSQWFGVARKAITESGDIRVTGDKNLDVNVEAVTGVEDQYRRTDPRRRGPRGADAWKFEGGFLKPFFKAGAKVVDRSAIMRLTASSSQTGRNPDVQHIETQSLVGYADLLVEILVDETEDGTRIQRPTSLFVTEDSYIYICDSSYTAVRGDVQIIKDDDGVYTNLKPIHAVDDPL